MYMHTYMYVCTYVYMYMDRMYVYMYIDYMYVYTHQTRKHANSGMEIGCKYALDDWSIYR